MGTTNVQAVPDFLQTLEVAWTEDTAGSRFELDALATEQSCSV
jgi:hypothetical protein